MARWVEDPQGRQEVEKVTEKLKLPVWKPNHKGKFRDFWNEVWEKIEDAIVKLQEHISNKLTYGLEEGTVLEGKRLAEALGVEKYGGVITTSGQKRQGYAYYDPATRGVFLCKQTTSVTNASAQYFTPFSNKALLEKLENLLSFTSHNNNIYSFRMGEITMVYGQFNNVPKDTPTLINLPYTLKERVVLASLWHSQTTESYSVQADILGDKLQLVATGRRSNFSGYFFAIGRV